MTAMTQQKSIPFSMKIAIIALIMASTLGYSLLKKRQIDKLTGSDNNLILKQIPVFEVPRLSGDERPVVTSENLFEDGSKAAMIHFWGTWCGPCEAELPEFINFMKKNESKGLKAILLAVQDDDKAIKKYLKRYGTLPSNIEVVHDKKGDLMLSFGTVKVPETYLFGNNGKNLNKFIGPQTWNSAAIQNRVDFYLNSLTSANKSYKIESH